MGLLDISMALVTNIQLIRQLNQHVIDLPNLVRMLVCPASKQGDDHTDVLPLHICVKVHKIFSYFCNLPSSNIVRTDMDDGYVGLLDLLQYGCTV